MANILIADDIFMHHHGYKRVLEQNNRNVVVNCIHEEEDVYTFLNTNHDKIDVVFVDILWEGDKVKKGDVITKHIKTHYPNIKVIIMTHFEEDIQLFQEMVNAGADGFVKKTNFHTQALVAVDVVMMNHNFFLVPEEWKAEFLPAITVLRQVAELTAKGYNGNAIINMGYPAVYTQRNAYKNQYLPIDVPLHIIHPEDDKWNEIFFLIMELRLRNPEIIKYLEEMAEVKITINTMPEAS
jgi:DNA-binding NarL/FixJ family response regulator